MKSLGFALLSTMCFAFFFSCQEEDLEVAAPTQSIKTEVGFVNALDTKSAPSGEELTRTIVMDVDSLLLQEFVSDNLSLPCVEDGCPETKGTVVTTDNISANYSTFGMECFLDNYDEIDCEPHNMPVLTGDDQYISGGLVSYDSTDSEWKLVDGSGNPYNWLWEMKHIFWSYAPQTHSGTYSYGSAGSRKTMTISNYTSPTAAADQKDLIVAYNYQLYGESQKTETLDIKFRHALADIFFDVSGVEDATVSKIEIIGAYSKGSCTVAGEYLADTDVTRAFSWGSLSTAVTFSMTSTSDHFFLIPQTLPTGAKVRITLDGTTTKEVAFTATWQPGKYYKYKLTYDGAEYSFGLAPTSPSSPKTFSGKSTTESEYESFIIESTKKKGSSAAEQWDWDIQSYQIGSGEEVPVSVTATSFTAEDLVVTEVKTSTSNELKIESKQWEGIDKGGHDYWINKNGISGDSSGSGWSPADWSGTYTTDNPLDLSNHDFNTGNATTRATANCYIIRHAGTYKIPLVYGNGVYSFSGGSLSTFRNHADQNITSPFIENNKRNSSGSKCTAGSATVEWQDRQETGLGAVIPTSSVKLVGSTATTYTESNVRYIQFTVSPENIRQTNAVIAVRDNTSSNNIMWSWHIWVTNDPDVTKGPISVKNHSDDSYGFFPSTALGWIEPKTYEDREDVKINLVQKSSGKTITVAVKQTKPDKIASSGVMYQWGRKDPFPTVGTPPTSGTKVTLGGAIQAPNKFITGSQNWCSDNSGTPYRNLWAGKYSGYASTSGTSTASTLTSKTIYDPSPVGYKVPSISAYSGFSTTGQDPTTAAQYNVPSGTTFDKGWNFNTGVGTGTIFFDASGWSNNGSVSGKGEDGNYHSALIYNSGNMITYLAFGSNYLNLTQTQYTTLGAAVRPVQE